MNSTMTEALELVPSIEFKRAYNRKRRDIEVVIERLCVAIISLFVVLTVVYTAIKLNNYAEENKELRSQLMSANNKIETYENKIKVLEEDISNYDKVVEDIPGYIETIDTQSTTITELIDDNTSLATEYDSLYEAYDTLKNREELYDKYAYAIMYNGNRTDLTYDQIIYGEELMKEKNLDPDLLFAIGMVESRFDETAKNQYSGASGYFQIMNGTGEFVSKSLLGRSYNRASLMNGDTNMELAVTLLGHLDNVYDHDTFMMMKSYSGNSTISGTQKYINKLNSFLVTKNKNIEDLLLASAN